MAPVPRSVSEAARIHRFAVVPRAERLSDHRPCQAQNGWRHAQGGMVFTSSIAIHDGSAGFRFVKSHATSIYKAAAYDCKEKRDAHRSRSRSPLIRCWSSESPPQPISVDAGRGARPQQRVYSWMGLLLLHRAIHGLIFETLERLNHGHSIFIWSASRDRSIGRRSPSALRLGC